MKYVVISQPRYLPAINYLQRLYHSDLFVFLDTVQRQGRGWENRNKIFLKKGNKRWLTIPVSSSSREIIAKSIIAEGAWVERHKNMLKQVYFKHPYFSEDLIEKYYSGVESILMRNNINYSSILLKMLKNICEAFYFIPKTILASEYDDSSSPGNERLLNICKKLQADTYVSGENGRCYGIKETFYGSGVAVKFHEFRYPIYQQFNSSNFHPWLCFFDIVFNIGIEKVGQLIKKEWVLVE